MYTVKQLSTLACVSVRTLHYYDSIGLLKPAQVNHNGYRYYDEQDMLRLQQILFFKELDLSLEEIQAIMDSPTFDIQQALQQHRNALLQRKARLDRLIHTVDETIRQLGSNYKVDSTKLFEGFSEEKQHEYEQEIRERYGENAFDGVRDWNSISTEEKAQIKSEGQAIYSSLLDLIDQPHDSPDVQAVIARWHQHLRYFYKPTMHHLRGLPELYTQHPDFVAMFAAMHPTLPQFLKSAILHYCDVLEAERHHVK